MAQENEKDQNDQSVITVQANIVKYNETIIGMKYDEELNADNFIGCTFIECIFADKPNVNLQVQKLLGSQTLIRCWYNPVNVFAGILNTLHENVNIIDALNKAWIKNDNKKNQDTNKQLILLDLNK